jgi:uncharacterized protein YndB with AHSA1/START domain
MTEADNKLDMVLIRVFDAPVEQLWKAWSDPELVKKWWGPNGYTAPVAELDFREGGVSLVCMRGPDGRDLYNSWTYTKIVPMERLEFVQHFVDQDGNKIAPTDLGLPPLIPFEVPHVVTLKSLGDNQTELTVTESGYPVPPIVEISRQGMRQCLDKMAAILASP